MIPCFNRDTVRTAVGARSFPYLTVLVLLILSSCVAQGQTFQVLYSFLPPNQTTSRLTLDRAGNIYGSAGTGENGNGLVYKLAPKNGSWIFTPLLRFDGGTGGRNPSAVIFGPDGALYGGAWGGGAMGAGLVFRLTPPSTFCPAVSCSWKESVLYTFQGGSDGGGPGEVVFDPAGNVYGTTYFGGDNNCGFYDEGCGTLYKLSPAQDGWTINVLHAFEGLPPHGGEGDGDGPIAPVVLDNAGNIYGSTSSGGEYQDSCYFGCGMIFQFRATDRQLYTMYNFSDTGDGVSPSAPLLLDSGGNLLGAAGGGGSGNPGSVFAINTQNWIFNKLADYDGDSTQAGLAMDAAGNLYGVDQGGAYLKGSVFKLTPSLGGWIRTDLYDFTGGADGWDPDPGVAIDGNGNLYGTTVLGGVGQKGTIWKITP